MSHLELGQADVAAAEVVGPPHLRRVAQPPLEVVRPVVQGAPEQPGLGIARVLGQQVAAVLADRERPSDTSTIDDFIESSTSASTRREKRSFGVCMVGPISQPGLRKAIVLTPPPACPLRPVWVG